MAKHTMTASRKAALRKAQLASAAKRKGRARGNTKNALLKQYKELRTAAFEEARQSNKRKHKVNRLNLTPKSKDTKNILKGVANTMRDQIRRRNYWTGRTKSYGAKIRTKF